MASHLRREPTTDPRIFLPAEAPACLSWKIHHQCENSSRIHRKSQQKLSLGTAPKYLTSLLSMPGLKNLPAIHKRSSKSNKHQNNNPNSCFLLPHSPHSQLGSPQYLIREGSQRRRHLQRCETLWGFKPSKLLKP